MQRQHTFRSRGHTTGGILVVPLCNTLPGPHSQAIAAGTHVSRVHGPCPPTGSHTPAFPVPACFSGNSALSSPPPRPEALAIFLASLVSAPFSTPAPNTSAHRTWPRAPRDLGRHLPHRHSRGDSRPLSGPRIFPAGYVGSREESGHELPPGIGAHKRGLNRTPDS